MKRIAVYPGTFDPITNGHVDIIERAVKLFDHVIVAVASSQRKSPYINIDQRVRLAKEVLAQHHNVSVERLSGLLVDFAKRNHASCILRGLRAVSDFDYEFQLAGMNRRLAPGIETLFLPASEATAYVSATIVREILDLGGDASQFLPEAVANLLKKKEKWH